MYRLDDVKTILGKLKNAVIEKKDYLGELDGKSGDGDLGMSMELAFTAIADAGEAYAGESISEMLLRCAMSCNKAAPSTMGTLITSGIMAYAKECKGKEFLSGADVIAAPRILADAIAQRGKSGVGQKTILDALYPMADAVEEANRKGCSLKDCFAYGADAAQKAAADTAGMLAKSGRAKWLGERAAQYPDSGAVLCGILAHALVN